MPPHSIISKALFLVCFALLETHLCAQETFNVPQGSVVTIDGKIEEKEWQDASAFDLSNGGKIYFKHDGHLIYVGVRGVKPGWSHLYLSEGESSDVSVIHASAAMGKIIYRQDQNKIWQPANDFVWELRDRTITAETQKRMSAYFDKNNWVASNNNMGNPSEIEFKLKPQNASERVFHVAVVYQADGISPQFFPKTLADDSLNSKLLTGYSTNDLKFNLSQWARINLVSKKN
jgi:hypothetical protein